MAGKEKADGSGVIGGGFLRASDNETQELPASLPVELPADDSAGNVHGDFDANAEAAMNYAEMPVELPAQMPAEEDDFYDNDTYRIELEFNPQPEFTKVQIRMRAKGPSRYSIVVGNYTIGRLTKRQLARVKEKTLPAAIKRAISEGDIEDAIIYRILTRRGKGETGDDAKGQRARLRGRNVSARLEEGRENGLGVQPNTGRRQPADKIPSITESQRIN